MSLQPGDTYDDDDDRSWVEDLSRKKDMEKLHLQEMECDDSGKKTRRSKLTKFLGFLLLGAVAAVVVLGVKYHHVNEDRRQALHARSMEQVPSNVEDVNDGTPEACNHSDVCTTEACVLAASYIIKSMDSRVDPCDNFYDFACGGWRTSRELPADKGHYAAYTVLRDSVSLKLKGILEEENEEDIEPVKQAKYVYGSCVDEDEIEADNVTGFIKLMDELGGWPLLGCTEGGKWTNKQYNLQTLVNNVQKYNNVPLINTWVGMDDRNNSINTIFIDQVWLAMYTPAFYSDDTHKEKKEAYRAMIYNTAVLLGSNADDLDEQVDDVVEFETNLSKILAPASDRRDLYMLYNPMTIAELQDQFTNQDDIPDIKFDWLSFLQATLDLSGENVTLTEEEVIVNQGTSYFKHLFPLLNVTPAKTVANYMVWRIVKNRLSNMPKRFRDEAFKLNKVLYGNKTPQPRWKICTRYLRHPYSMVLGRLFVERYFSKESKAEVSTMINNIREAFKGMVDELEWMDDGMKEVAKEKADYIVEVIGYPEYIFDDDKLGELYKDLTNMDPDNYFENILTVLKHDAKEALTYLRDPNDLSERRKWMTSPTTVNAYYHQQRNMISFPAGILQPSYFHVDHPKYLNYGGIGFMIGHEITHGFDDMGRQYDKEGNLLDWWTEDAATLYNILGECYIDQYSNYTDPVAGRRLNAVKNHGENIADNSGVKETFMAYRTWVEANGAEQLLPGLQHFNQEQLFFLSYAQLRCDLTRPADAVAHILNGVHSPNRFRVIGPLQNMPEFSEVFQCPAESYMNPDDKCTLW